MSLGAFAVVAARERELGEPVTLDNLAGFGWERPFLGVAMWTFMLGFAGLPLTGGFVGKFYVFSAAYEPRLDVARDRRRRRHGVSASTTTSASSGRCTSPRRAVEPRPVSVGGSPPREIVLGTSRRRLPRRHRRLVLRRRSR